MNIFQNQNVLEEVWSLNYIFSNYAAKADWKNAADVDTVKFAKVVYLASLYSDTDKLHFDKLKNVPKNLNNLKSRAGKLNADKWVSGPFWFKVNQLM